MGKLFTALRGSSMRTKAIVTMIAAAVIVPAGLFAWGPTRATFTIANPATYITFNAITDNPEYGDERNFTRIKDTANTNAGGWSDELNVQPGKEYWVQIYVHNNAASTLNLVAQNTRVTAAVPNTTAKQITVEGFINADNANPQQVWDQAIFKSDKEFNITYQPGSTKLYNKVFPSGIAMSDNIVNPGGTPVGFDKLDGKIPGCFNFSGYVSFKVKVNEPKKANFTVSKKVSKHGANNWQESYAAKPGENVDFLIQYKNTDTAQQNNVMVKDTLPQGLSYVNGSTVYGTRANPDGTKASDNVTTTGINIGSYAQNGGTWVRFTSKVADADKLSCGDRSLINVGRVTTEYGYKEDTANVTVNRPCKPGETPVAELPQTGVDGGVLAAVSLGIATAGAAYAATSRRVRNLLRG